MTVADKYLNLYKTWESLLRDTGSDIRTLESGLEQTDPAQFARVRMCRLFRNYLTHENDPGFLIPTDMMFGFIESQVNELKSRDDIVKKHLRYTGNYLFEHSVKCTVALEKALPAKIQTVVRHNQDGSCELVSTFDVMQAALASKATKLSAVKALRNKPVYVEAMDKIAALDVTRIHICTSDGSPSGDILGVVKF